jgi:hypothetical protein
MAQMSEMEEKITRLERISTEVVVITELKYNDIIVVNDGHPILAKVEEVSNIKKYIVKWCHLETEDLNKFKTFKIYENYAIGKPRELIKKLRLANNSIERIKKPNDLLQNYWVMDGDVYKERGALPSENRHALMMARIEAQPKKKYIRLPYPDSPWISIPWVWPPANFVREEQAVQADAQEERDREKMMRESEAQAEADIRRKAEAFRENVRRFGGKIVRRPVRPVEPVRVNMAEVYRMEDEYNARQMERFERNVIQMEPPNA